jgi:hypothetical protein
VPGAPPAVHDAEAGNIKSWLGGFGRVAYARCEGVQALARNVEEVRRPHRYLTKVRIDQIEMQTTRVPACPLVDNLQDSNDTFDHSVFALTPVVA